MEGRREKRPLQTKNILPQSPVRARARDITRAIGKARARSRSRLGVVLGLTRIRG